MFQYRPNPGSQPTGFMQQPVWHCFRLPASEGTDHPLPQHRTEYFGARRNPVPTQVPRAPAASHPTAGNCSCSLTWSRARRELATTEARHHHRRPVAPINKWARLPCYSLIL